MLGNRKIIISVIIISIAGILFFLVTKILIKLKEKEKIADQIKTFPKLSVEAIGLNKFELWGKSGKVSVVIFFNSSCEHCQYEAITIAQELASFRGTNLLFISEESAEEIATFSREYQLNDKPEVWWLKMDPDNVYKTFGSIAVPHIWIYNKDGRLVKEFKGETKVEAIMDWL